MQLLLHVSLSAEPPVERIALTGSHETFGRWNPRGGVTLEQCGSFWVTKDPIVLAPGERVEFKCVRIRATGEVDWELGSNRILQIPPDGSDIHFQGTFNGDGVVRFKNTTLSESVLWKQRHDEAVQALEVQRKDFDCRRVAHEMKSRYRAELLQQLKNELEETQRQLKASLQSCPASSSSTCAKKQEVSASVLPGEASRRTPNLSTSVSAPTLTTNGKNDKAIPSFAGACDRLNGTTAVNGQTLTHTENQNESSGGPPMTDLAPSRFIGAVGERSLNTSNDTTAVKGQTLTRLNPPMAESSGSPPMAETSGSPPMTDLAPSRFIGAVGETGLNTFDTTAVKCQELTRVNPPMAESSGSPPMAESSGSPMADLAPSRFIGAVGERSLNTSKPSSHSLYATGTRSPRYERGCRSPGVRSPALSSPRGPDGKRSPGGLLDDKSSSSKEVKRTGLLTVGTGSSVGLLASKEVMKAFDKAKEKTTELKYAPKGSR